MRTTVLALGRSHAVSVLVEAGEMVLLTARTLVSAVRPPYPYGEEFVQEFLAAVRVCCFPLVISMMCVCFGVPGLQAGGFLTQIGALDRLGGFFVLATIRELAPFVTAIVVLGAAGSAITADLGSRKIREELDALQVLGVDPVKNLVVPRFLALVLATCLLDTFALTAGMASGLFTDVLHGESFGGFFTTFVANASVLDLAGSVIKCTCFGAIVAIVCCYKGMTVSGGAAGVGKGVNDAVVVSLLGIGAFNYVFTQSLLATHPQLQTLR
jgi:phospholipid/cholesterol/gamma-HCH transport system permease protein